ncbi:molecular chaperone GrpE (heat shock protein) [Saprospira grandis DSM 2844]|uniref:Protein GrpE n=1 Tax=Saprospira grandis DSM 2844 TaxID=694433 RepID=J1I1H5_9BACT|nr:nucleotide exchange factor GrpE [Saprospira grandis]EJF52540.1 molecular chaperone GrpE (heat shock protein) [Saprospira grandis DSM 2844]
MEEKKQEEQLDPQEEQQQQEEQLQADAQTQEEETVKETAAPKDEKEKLAQELAEMKDKYLRIYAEFDNFRKRNAREKLQLIQTAAADTIKSLLPVLDDFDRAVKAGQELDDGIMLIYEKMKKALVQKGLEEMESTGQAFDPDFHEALTKVPAPTEELKGKVIDTVEKGYILNEKIIRYAKVVVGQ